MGKANTIGEEQLDFLMVEKNYMTQDYQMMNNDLYRSDRHIYLEDTGEYVPASDFNDEHLSRYQDQILMAFPQVATKVMSVLE